MHCIWITDGNVPCGKAARLAGHLYLCNTHLIHLQAKSVPTAWLNRGLDKGFHYLAQLPDHTIKSGFTTQLNYLPKALKKLHKKHNGPINVLSAAAGGFRAKQLFLTRFYDHGIALDIFAPVQPILDYAQTTGIDDYCRFALDNWDITDYFDSVTL